jgi:sigma-B regulation protein RsbU (phosphoserine phosphatase)
VISWQRLNQDASEALKGVVYKEHLYTEVKPGQVYMALTDGLFETFSKKGEMFGKDRVRKLIRDFANLSASEITERINVELSRFLGGTRPDDDLTFVIVKAL